MSVSKRLRDMAGELRHPCSFREDDPEAGAWTATYADGREEPRYGHPTPWQRRRMSARPTLGYVSTIHVADGDGNADGLEERRQLARRVLHPTREAYVESVCAPMSPAKVASATGQDRALQIIAETAITAPYGHTIDCSLGELLSVSDRWYHHSYGDTSGLRREVDCESLAEVIVRQLVADGCSDLNAREHLRRLLSSSWYRGTLAELGVTVELQGDDVLLSFVDPCHEHRKRLGREAL